MSTRIDGAALDGRARTRLIDRSKVIEASLTILAEHGYDALSMRRLATDLLVSLPTIYSVINSRAGLVGEVLAAALDDFARAGFDAGPSDAHALQAAFGWLGERRWVLQLASELTPQQREAVWLKAAPAPIGKRPPMAVTIHVFELIDRLVADHLLQSEDAGATACRLLHAL